jgi:putative membrane protein
MLAREVVAMMYGSDGGWGWGAGLAMGFMMLVFFGLIAAVVVMLLQPPAHREEPPAGPPGAASATEDQALRILDERFARGEIDEQEYRARRELLASR